MATYEDVPIQVEDVQFQRSMSTKQWTRSPAPSSAPRHDRRSKHYVSSQQRLAAAVNQITAAESGYREQTSKNRVTRVGGVTSMLPTQQFPSKQRVSQSPSTDSIGTLTSPVAQPKPQKGHQRLKPSVSAPSNAEVIPSKQPLPSADVLNALFDRLMNQLHLSPDKVAEINMRTPEQKWSLVLAQQDLHAGIACVFYIEQLVRHAQPQLKEKHPKKRLLHNLQPLSKILKDLEVDLRTNPNDSWVSEFVSTPNHGHVALIDLIQDLADNPYSVPRKNPRKYVILEREPTYLYTALLCLKALTSHRQGFNAVLTYDPSLCVLAYCLNTESTRTKVLILKMMVTFLLATGGHKKVMQAFDYLRAIMKEKMRFQLLIASLTNEPVEPTFQAAALCFINTVVQTARGTNAKVFHQHEFLEAGYNPDEIERSLHGRQDERVLHELKEWSRNFIDVQLYVDDLAVTKGKVRNLQEEIEDTNKLLHEADLDRNALYEQTKNLIEKYERQRNKLNRLNESFSELLPVKLERDELKVENEQLQEANKRYHEHTNELQDKVERLLDENKSLISQEAELSDLQQKVEVLSKLKPEGEDSMTTTKLDTEGQGSSEEPDTAAAPLATNIPVPPPLPPILDTDGSLIPPAPPIPFGVGGFSMATSGLPGVPMKKPVIPNVPLPMLNWVPVRNPGQTIFKELNDDDIIETVDFSEFESLFQVKRLKKSDKSSKKEKNRKKHGEEVTVIEHGRSRNILIAKHRIGHNAADIRDFIMETDLDGLPGEYCELLLKFIPTEEELKELAKNAHRYDNFADADQFMYQLAKIERYEARLNCMAYMGNFDELLRSTQPLIDAVLSASLSIFRSRRLKKVFEIILAFGNYMNSSRRGAVYGFKLESLTKIKDTKSMDRKQTLLHYMVHVVEMVYPNVLSFYDDLNLEEACQLSMQLLNEDVQLLKKGLEDVREEKEKEPNNFIVFSFFNHAVRKVNHVIETYAKMEDAYREVCLMFDESPKQIDPADFFGIFATFVKDWKAAVNDNHSSKRKRKATTNTLLRREEPEIKRDALATLALEAAAEAAVRSKNIQDKAEQLETEEEIATTTKKMVQGEVVQDLEAEAIDIRERGIHSLDLRERLPWLKKREAEERVTSPDSGLEQLSPDESGSHDVSHDELQKSIEGSLHSLLQNGILGEHEIELPPRDYDIELPEKDYLENVENLPPKDYPKSAPVTNAQVLDDNDYYSMMINGQ